MFEVATTTPWRSCQLIAELTEAPFTPTKHVPFNPADYASVYKVNRINDCLDQGC